MADRSDTKYTWTVPVAQQMGAAEIRRQFAKFARVVLHCEDALAEIQLCGTRKRMNTSISNGSIYDQGRGA